MVPVEPARGGPFAQLEHLPGMVRNMGGQGDTNQRLTRRMLFLLEGEPLTDVADFRAARRTLLERYIAPRVGDGMLPLFLLNDLIRYYRTIAVDYEFKTSEADKPWGLRNLKLVFSRKLLYASGLFAIAATRDGPADAKIARLEALLALTPIDRMAALCGGTAVEPILDRYDHFLDRLGAAGPAAPPRAADPPGPGRPGVPRPQGRRLRVHARPAAPVHGDLPARPPDPPGDRVLKAGSRRLSGAQDADADAVAIRVDVDLSDIDLDRHDIGRREADPGHRLGQGLLEFDMGRIGERHDGAVDRVVVHHLVEAIRRERDRGHDQHLDRDPDPLGRELLRRIGADADLEIEVLEDDDPRPVVDRGQGIEARKRGQGA